MENHTGKTKRIAKNTLLLYVRLIITMFISFFTARYTLQLLGAEDYGINNVTGGLIGFIGIIINIMETATQRFLAFDLGSNNIKQYHKTFSMLLNIYAIFCLVATIILEITGPYFISNCLNIPSHRLYAAQCIFQFSILMFIVGTMSIPFTASIIAYEKINIYAYFTIIDVTGQLLTVLVLFYTPYDKLISFGILTTIMCILRIGIIIFYCITKLNGCKYYFFWDKNLFKKILGYAGWNMFATGTYFLNNQGLSILLNIYFGPIINSSKAIADRVNTTVTSFSNNFYIAVAPQIIKSYAANDITYMRELVLKSSRLAFFLLSAISIPIIFNAENILYFWLGKDQVTHNMIIFCQLTLIYSLVSVLENPITQSIRATGNIKKYQIIIGLQVLSFIPICWVVFKIGYPSFYSMIVLCALYFIVHFSRIKIVCPIIQITIKEYIKVVLVPIIYTILCSIALIFSFISLIKIPPHLFYLKLIICIFINSICIFAIGLNKNEKKFVTSKLKKIKSIK